MPNKPPPIKELWALYDFKPNENQEKAILHTDGPLYLPAGPGSGKTRVLLWHTLFLIAYCNVSPDEIYLSTFTEKAAFQLQEGIRTLLSHVTNSTGQPYDISRMYVGTIHSLCNRILTDRKFSGARRRHQQPSLLDDIEQYFYLSRSSRWRALVDGLDLGDGLLEIYTTINGYFGRPSASRHQAEINCIALFNRFSEECIDPQRAIKQTRDEVLKALLTMYDRYLRLLAEEGAVPRTDFSLMQQEAYKTLQAFDGSGSVFKHVIIDEYQDTNSIQERLIFQLASGSRNICVVGDDDQALYRFRGATVENFVDFPEKCLQYLGEEPTEIPLETNYRSRGKIVSFYSEFMQSCDWSRRGKPKLFHRVPKNIRAFRADDGPSVVASAPGHPDVVCPEIARFVKKLLDTKKVEDENQIAFLFPSLKTDQVERFRTALEKLGLKIYAPRAGSFLKVDEAVAVFGVFAHVFGKATPGHYPGRDYHEFTEWTERAHSTAQKIVGADPLLKQFVKDKKEELLAIGRDYRLLTALAEKKGWQLDKPYDIELMKRPLYSITGLSEKAKRNISSGYFDRVVRSRLAQGKPVTLQYALSRATSLDWNVLDLFYRLCTFDHFKSIFERAAARGKKDEGPICNMGLISQELARFMDLYRPVITAELLVDDRYQHWLFGSYLYTIFRLGESEYENPDDPFPKGRIPFLTIHQAKGLEFPVVVFGNPRKSNRAVQKVEEIVHPLVERKGEPLDRIPEFDMMRLFYVALSRAKNLVVIPHWKGGHNYVSPPLRELVNDEHVTRIPAFDMDELPAAKMEKEDVPKNYSYTGDYLSYQKCPRQYMVFRKYGFVASRSQTMFFGSLVHRTLEDLHQHLIAQKAAK